MSAARYIGDMGESHKVQAWWFSHLRPGGYVVTLWAPGGFSVNFNAVVDDFGDLVRVAA